MAQDQTPIEETAQSNVVLPADIDTRLKDILDLSNYDPENIFNRYIPQKEIAEKIGEKLLKEKYSAGKKNTQKGFFNSDISRDVGLITDAIGLQAVADLCGMGMLMNMDKDKSGASYFDKVTDTLSRIFSQLGFDEETFEKIFAYYKNYDESSEALNKKTFDTIKITFKMTPFISDDDVNAGEESTGSLPCVEAAAQTVKALMGIRTALLNDSSIKGRTYKFSGNELVLGKFVERLNYLICYAMDWINSAVIPASSEIRYDIDGTEAESPIVEYLGWNFFKDDSNEEYEPSIYMTYSVCSAYMSLFEVVYPYYYESKRDGKDWIKAFESEEEFRKMRGESVPYSEADAKLARLINTQYARLKKRCMTAGRYEELRCRGRIDIATKFIGQNYTEVDMADILNSTTNDALINTVLHALILIYAGIDIDYKKIGEKINKPSLQTSFYEEIQYALQNVLRVYNRLKAEDKLYIVEQYVLSFNEKMPSSKAGIAKQLRRQRIQVASTLPMLIRAYNEVSRYLVKFPQKQNTEYLALIMENRTGEEGKKEWMWDLDGYNLMSEANFVRALSDFYEYYDRYERVYIKGESEKLAERERKQEEERRENSAYIELQSKYADLEKANKAAVKENERLKEESKNKIDPVSALEIVVNSLMEKNKKKYAELIFNTVIEDCRKDVGSAYEKDSLQWKAAELLVLTLLPGKSENGTYEDIFIKGKDGMPPTFEKKAAKVKDIIMDLAKKQDPD